MKNFIWTEEDKLWNKQDFAENKPDYTGCLKNAVSIVQLLYCIDISDPISELITFALSLIIFANTC